MAVAPARANAPQNAMDVTAVPIFTFPSHSYVSKLRKIFQAAGLNIADQQTSREYAPIVISRLPSDIVQFLPANIDLTTLLNFLAVYDDKKDTTQTILTNLNHSIKPSLRYQTVRNKLAHQLDPNTPVVTLDQLAWNATYASFPPNVQSMITLIEIQNAPSEAQFKQIDKIHQQSSATTSNATIKAVGPNTAVELDMDNRLAALEHKMQRAAIANPKQQTPTNYAQNNGGFAPRQNYFKPPQYTQPRYSPPQQQWQPQRTFRPQYQPNYQTSRGLQQQATFQQRPYYANFQRQHFLQPRQQPFQWRPQNANTQLCFYHQRFGKWARQCTPPCCMATGGNPPYGYRTNQPNHVNQVNTQGATTPP